MMKEFFENLLIGILVCAAMIVMALLVNVILSPITAIFIQ